MLKVRKAREEEFDIIMEIYDAAQDFMIAVGNPNQWKKSTPSSEQIQEDINKGICHVICEDEIIYGVFALCPGIDPTYLYIEDGNWLNEEAYVTIHRIAGNQKKKGIFAAAVEYCKELCDNIRIDTHHDNKVMQTLLAKNKFHKCGIIYLKNKEPRIAYHWKKS